MHKRSFLFLGWRRVQAFPNRTQWRRHFVLHSFFHWNRNLFGFFFSCQLVKIQPPPPPQPFNIALSHNLITQASPHYLTCSIRYRTQLFVCLLFFSLPIIRWWYLSMSKHLNTPSVRGCSLLNNRVGSVVSSAPAAGRQEWIQSPSLWWEYWTERKHSCSVYTTITQIWVSVQLHRLINGCFNLIQVIL